LNFFLLVFLFLGIISTNLFAQEFGIKAGTGFSYVYQTGEFDYFRNTIRLESNPCFFLSLRINWHLVGNLYLALEPGVIEKNGKVTGINVGQDSQNNVVYGYQEYTLWNLENSLLINYNIAAVKDILLDVYFGPGSSWNVSDKQNLVLPATPIIHYNAYPASYYKYQHLTNTGPYIAAGINISYQKFQFDLRYIKEYSDLIINVNPVTLEKYRSYLFNFLIGYVF